MIKNATIRHRVWTLARLAKPSLIPAFIAAAVVFTGGYLFAEQNRANFRNELKSSVQNDLNLVSLRLQSEINNNITALRGFANNFSADPNIAQSLFDQLATKLLIQNPQMVRVSAAPNAVIQMTFPLAGNERMIGTDFKKFRSSRVAMDRAASKAKPILAGPVRLPSGRTGFNLFSPVFTKAGDNLVFWGFMEAVIDERDIYANAGLIDTGQHDDEADGTNHRTNIQLAIRDVSVQSSIQDAFFGDTDLFEKSPVIRQLQLPGGTWELAAIPAEGWAQEPANGTWIDIAIFIAAAIIIIPIFLTGGFVNERQRNIAKLRSRERELLTVSHRLNLALESSKIGIWEIDLDTQERSWDERMYHLHGLPPGNGAPQYGEWRGHGASRRYRRGINDLVPGAGRGSGIPFAVPHHRRRRQCAPCAQCWLHPCGRRRQGQDHRHELGRYRRRDDDGAVAHGKSHCRREERRAGKGTHRSFRTRAAAGANHQTAGSGAGFLQVRHVGGGS